LSDVSRDESDDSDENLSDFLENENQNGADDMEFEERLPVVVETNKSSLRAQMKNFKQNYCNLI